MVRNKSFSPSEICIWVRIDKYNTINRSCSRRGGKERGRGGGRQERGKGERKKEREVEGKGEEAITYLCGYPVSNS